MLQAEGANQDGVEVEEEAVSASSPLVRSFPFKTVCQVKTVESRVMYVEFAAVHRNSRYCCCLLRLADLELEVRLK